MLSKQNARLLISKIDFFLGGRGPEPELNRARAKSGWSKIGLIGLIGLPNQLKNKLKITQKND